MNSGRGERKGRTEAKKEERKQRKKKGRNEGTKTEPRASKKKGEGLLPSPLHTFPTMGLLSMRLGGLERGGGWLLSGCVIGSGGGGVGRGDCQGEGGGGIKWGGEVRVEDGMVGLWDWTWFDGRDGTGREIGSCGL